jgi:FMN-dependent oxidoreductase (nitrilotriacetate monooxygenase family)
MRVNRDDQMALVAFMQAGSTSVYSGSWRHPAADHRFLDATYYAELGQLLERGCFDLMFFDDRLAMPGIYGGSVAEAVRYGARPIKLDLSVVLGIVAQATSRIGLGATYSTTYYSPYHVARTFATLDALSGGRAAWNVVTSVNDSEAQNFGVAQHMSSEQRYDRADEFMEVVAGLWGSWDDDALVLNRETGIFADPDKVHELGHRGTHFSSRGPLTVPRSPQGHPVVLQAGSSGRGREFASRWAELIFTGDPGIEVARTHYADQKERIAEAGRDPASVKICPMAYVVVGESAAHAVEREQMLLNDLVHPLASLTLLSELMNYDFAAHDLDEVITDEFVNSTNGIRGLVDNIRAHIGGDVRIRDLAGHRATLLQGPRFVGTATQVADQMSDWFTSGACDGFVLAATHFPGAFEDVVRMVVPELQRRGLFREQYTGATLRSHLGLERTDSLSSPAGAAAGG